MILTPGQYADIRALLIGFNSPDTQLTPEDALKQLCEAYEALRKENFDLKFKLATVLHGIHSSGSACAKTSDTERASSSS